MVSTEAPALPVRRPKVLFRNTLRQDLAALGQELRSGERDARREAALQLQEMGEGALPALPALIEALSDDDEQVAARAVSSL